MIILLVLALLLSRDAAAYYNTSGDTAQMTIAALRAANSLQQFRERNNLGFSSFCDQIQDRYGVRPSDGVAQRPICIGSARMIFRLVVLTRLQITLLSLSDKNPFSSVAAQYGRGGALGNDYLIDNLKPWSLVILWLCSLLYLRRRIPVGIEKMFPSLSWPWFYCRYG